MIEDMGGNEKKEAIFVVLISGYIGLLNLGIRSPQVICHGLACRAADLEQSSFYMMAIAFSAYISFSISVFLKTLNREATV